MERFTKRARQVLMRAQTAAEAMQHRSINTEHLLLALFEESEGIASRALHQLGLHQADLEAAVHSLTRAESLQPGEQTELSSGTKHVLEHAVDEARRLGHHYIGTEHLLLGLVRQGDNTAVRILDHLQISPETVRQQTIKVLQEPPPTPPPVSQPDAGEAPICVLLPATPTSDTLFTEQIEPITADLNLTSRRISGIYTSGITLHEVVAQLHSARLIIADCSGKDASTLYTLGIAQTLGKPVIVLAQQAGDVPAILEDTPVIIYVNTPEGLAELADTLRAAISNLAAGAG